MTHPIDPKVKETARRAAALAYQAERGKWRVMSIPDNIAVPLADATIDAYEAALKAAGYEIAATRHGTTRHNAKLLECAEALQHLLRHSGIADVDARDKDKQDHDIERKARAALDALAKEEGE